MSHSVRFLAAAIATWAGVRAISLGLYPGANAEAAVLPDPLTAAPAAATAALAASAETLPPGQRMSPAQPLAGQPYAPAYALPYGALPPGAMPVPAPYYYYPLPVPVRMAAAPTLPPTSYASAPASGGGAWFSPGGEIMPRPMPSYALPATASTAAAASLPPEKSPNLGKAAAVAPGKLDRWKLHAWSYYRSERGGAPATPSLASAGMLGGSQGGARLTWFATPHLAASARVTSSLGAIRGTEAALGLRYQPFAKLPLAFTAERRERVEGVGRSAFAAFAEAGAWGVPLTGKFRADG
ncbi:hypothetical protein [Sphingomicrobium nitratireducens]|uniref:hypothetical protein n=1 Tax=Sphingomicrobium nitratireducens TaxID=2964666 RepID=UPI002240D85B|nr:hypothetical protein [Sphingomicrobium nitratireducens]